jgi:hypothetical protein
MIGFNGQILESEIYIGTNCGAIKKIIAIFVIYLTTLSMAHAT